MFEFGFTRKDAVRAAWSAFFATLAFVIAAQPSSVLEWKTVLAGAVGAGLSAIKNFVLAEGKFKG